MMYNSPLLSLCQMENGMINPSPEIADLNPMVLDGIASHLLSDALVQSVILSSQSQIIAGYPLLPTLRGEETNDLQDNFPIKNHGGIVDSNASISRNLLLKIQAIRNDSVRSLYHVNNGELHEQFSGETSLSATSLPNFLETSSTLHENLDGVTIYTPTAFPLEDLRIFLLQMAANTSDSSFAAFLNDKYNGGQGDAELMEPKDCNFPGQLDGKWDIEKSQDGEELTGKIPMNAFSEPYRFVGCLGPSAWMTSKKSNCSADDSYTYCMPNTELSKSCYMPAIYYHWNHHSTSVLRNKLLWFTRHSLHEVGLGTGLDSEQTCSKSKGLSLSYSSYKFFRISHILSGSKYLHVAQQILTDIASYSLGNIDNISYSPGLIGNGAKISFSSNCSDMREISVDSKESQYSAGAVISKDQIKFTLQRLEI